MIKALEIKTYMLCNLDFANNSVLLCFLSFSNLLTHTFAQTLNRIAEHVKLIEILSKEAKAEIRIHPVTTEAKIRKCSI